METPTITEVPEGDSTTAVRLGATRRTPSIRWKATAYSLLGALAFLLVWQLASGYTRTEFNLLPSPRAVFEQMRAYTFGDEAQGIPAGFVFVNLAVDVLYVAIDPRIRVD